MNVDDDGGQAFPISDASGPIQCGLTMRDWFAGQALVGLLAFPIPGSGKIPSNAALAAYDYADAMLAARKNTSGR